MRVLTVIATIFTPLAFIAGIYGMNFDRDAAPLNMPELGWPYGYLLVWTVMIGIAALMLVVFRRRNWFWYRALVCACVFDNSFSTQLLHEFGRVFAIQWISCQVNEFDLAKGSDRQGI